MSRGFGRLFWNRFTRVTTNLRPIPIIKNYKNHVNVFTTPCLLGFSIFTWLGFDKQKLSAEDELIISIKHCVLFIQRGEYDKAEQLLHVSLRQAQNIQHQNGITYVYDLMANLALQREQLDKAKKLFVAVTQRIMANGATEDDIRVVHLSCKLARVSHLQKEYSTAQLGYDWCLEKLSKVLNIEESDEVKKLYAMTEDWYGRLFLDCNRDEDGLKYLVSSYNKMKELKDLEKEHLVIQLNDIGTVCDRLGRADDSIEYYTEALQLSKNLNMEEDLGTIHVNLGRAYLKKNLLDLARKSCGYAWKLAVTSKNKELKNEAEMCINEINKS